MILIKNTDFRTRTDIDGWIDPTGTAVIGGTSPNKYLANTVSEKVVFAPNPAATTTRALFADGIILFAPPTGRTSVFLARFTGDSTATGSGYIGYVTGGSFLLLRSVAGSSSVVGSIAYTDGDVLSLGCAGNSLTLATYAAGSAIDNTATPSLTSTFTDSSAFGAGAWGHGNTGTSAALGMAVYSSGADFSITGPAIGPIGVVSSAFTITPALPYTGTITPNDGGAGGTFNPTSRTFSGSNTPQTFTYTPLSAGDKTLNATGSPSLIAPAPLTYTVTTYTKTAVTLGGVPCFVYAPAGLASTTPRKAVVWAHGAGGDRGQIDIAEFDFYRHLVTTDGWRIVSGDWGGTDTFGADVAQDAIYAGVTAFRLAYNTPDTVPYGVSMGGQNVATSLINNKIPVARGGYFNCAVFDPAAYGKTDAYYGGTGQLALHSPLALITADPTRMHNLPLRFVVATGDSAVPPSAHTTPFAAAVIAPEKVVISVSGEHVGFLTADAARTADFIAFANRSIATLTSITVTRDALSAGTVTFHAAPGGTTAPLGTTTAVIVSGGGILSGGSGGTAVLTPPAATSTDQVITVRFASGSVTGDGTYTVPAVGTVAVPTFSPVAGTYLSSQTVTLACATSDAAIHYTTDGTTPTSSSALYSAPLTVSTTQTIKALAVKAGSTDNAVASALFTINIPVDPPPSGTVYISQLVRGPLSLTPLVGEDVDAPQTCFTGDLFKMVFVLRDGAGEAVPVAADAPLSVSVSANGAVLTGTRTGGMEWAPGGIVSYILQAADTSTSGKKQITLSVGAASNRQTFGPIVLQVKGR